MTTIRFAVPGVERPAVTPPLPGVPLAKSIDVGLARDGKAELMLVEADSDRHVVALSFGNGPTLYVNPLDVASLVGTGGNVGRGAEGPAAGVVQIGSTLAGATSRGIMQQVLTGFGVFDFGAPQVAAELATPLVAKLIEQQVMPGLWKIRQESLPVKASLTEAMNLAIAPKAPLLVFVHGTASSTSGGYQGLWLPENKSLREELFNRYKDRVYALDHKTLTESPIDNALALVKALPAEARLHLVTHSRGGMIADLLSRAQTWQQDPAGKLTPATGAFDDADIAFFEGDAQYAGVGDKLRQLGQLLATRKIVVERVVRVASPSRGTVLASKRLDLYLSTLSWLLGKSAEAAVSAALVPVAGVLGAAQALAKLAAAIAHNRSDANKLPGLEAMMPERKLVAMLNRRDVRVGGDLRVIAGDIEPGDGFFSWLKVKLVDAFYWEDHDLVVNTSSMDKGPLRLPGRSYRLFVQGPEVDHFSYFKSPQTARAMSSALEEPVPAEFEPVELALASVAEPRAARSMSPRQMPDRPAVVLLHGIMGSHLKVGNQRVWFDLARILVGSFTKLKYDNPGVAVDGMLGRYYDRLTSVLSNSHEVIPFAYDWRAPMEDAAKNLGKVIAMALEARASSGQPVRVVAHSMGGLVWRAMQWQAPDVWARLMARGSTRILMLGVPNQGSMAPATVLTGRDAFVNMLDGVDLKNGAREFLGIAASFPGLLQMLACPADPSQDWYGVDKWEALLAIDQHQARNAGLDERNALPAMRHDWVVPARGLLDGARAFQEKLSKQDLAPYRDRICIVHGHARETPIRAELVDGRFEFESIAEGDGRVTWEAGRIPGAACAEWFVNAAHGDLADAQDAFNGYVELLLGGRTVSLSSTPPVRPAARGVGTAGSLPAERMRYGFAVPHYPGDGNELLDAAVGAWPRVRQLQRRLPEIEVEVLHANLRYVTETILVGHQEGTGLYSAERFLDGVYMQRLSRAIDLGVYPGALATSQVFLPPRDASGGWVKVRPEKALVVGLGRVGELTTRNLRETVTAALLKYAQKETEGLTSEAGPLELRIASLLIGTGASDINASDSTKAILGAVQNANLRLERAQLRPAVRYARLTLVDYYENMAVEALHAARQFAGDGSAGGGHALAPLRVLPHLRSTGPAYQRSRPKPGAGGWPLFINISRNDAGEIAFGLTSDRARTTVLRQPTQLNLVKRLVSEGESATAQNDTVGQLLFELTVPNDLKEIAGDQNALVLDVDPAAAALPWEMLTRVVDGERQYLSLRSQVVRKLRLEAFRPFPRDARGERALVIGAPLAPTLPRLPGAIAEACAVAQALKRQLPDHAVESLVERPMRDVLDAVLMGEWRIMHFAGHGEYRRVSALDNTSSPMLSGMVLSEGIVLSPIEIGQMRTVPELVFVNCCHLGKIEPGVDAAKSNSRTLSQGRGQFAANIAEQLIRNGVRCVIAAAWAVDDNAARDFAHAFYDALLAGQTLGKAALAARVAAYQGNPGASTWAAYQCYGDLEWRYRRDRAAAAPVEEVDVSDIVSPAELVDELEGLWVRADGVECGTRLHGELVERLDKLVSQYGKVWGKGGAVAAAFGRASSALGKEPEAIEWYGAAVTARDGQATLWAMEQWLNQTARQARDGPRAKEKINAAIKNLKALIFIASSRERLALLGSAYKRLSRVVVGDLERRAALKAMRDAYQKSWDETPDSERSGRLYATTNLLAASIAEQLAADQIRGDSRLMKIFATAQEDINAAIAEAPDFWAHVAEIDLEVYQRIHEGGLPQNKDALALRYKTLSGRAGDRNDWSSVKDQLAWLMMAVPEASEVLKKTRDALDSLRLAVEKLGP